MADVSAVVCKLSSDNVWKDNCGLTHVSMSAHYGATDNEINRAFSDATPAAQFSMVIGVDKPAAAFFNRGESYLVTITKITKEEEPPSPTIDAV